MKYFYPITLGCLFALIYTTPCNSQTWHEITTANRASKITTNSYGITTTEHKNFAINFSSLKTKLHASSFQKKVNTIYINTINFPNAAGKINPYDIQRITTMHPDLAAKYPGIASYKGYNVDDPTETIRITETPRGVHVTIFSNTHTSYISPLSNDGLTYKVYAKKAIVHSTEPIECLIGQKQTINDNSFIKKSSKNAAKAITDGKFRTLRIAIVTTAEFSNYYVNKADLNNGTTQQKKAAVIAGLNVLLNTLNDLYEKEFALSMVLIPDNDKIVFLDSNTDGLTNFNINTMIDQGNDIMNSEIGFNNFDIGHTLYRPSSGGSGLATFYTPCSTTSKGLAVTGSSVPEGERFVYGLWAHEIGHQFTAEHSFNNSCSDNRSPNSAVEPSSGTTIMSYAGTCTPNIQTTADPHFHGLSHKQISSFIIERINPSATCGVTVTNTNNNAPVIASIPNYTIPTDTPFVLTANATDANNDVLTYQFDQMDIGSNTDQPLATSQNGPIFRAVLPSTNAFRYFPNIHEVLANNLTPQWELIPSVARSMNFTVTVRDVRNSLGSQSAFRDFTVNFVKTQPFRVTSQSQNDITWTSGEQHQITWDVAGTTSNGINTQNVTIMLTTNKGATFDTILAANTPNDGSHTITVPNNIASLDARIMVKGVDNVFFALNTAPIAINTLCEDHSNEGSLAIPDNGNVVTSSITINKEIDTIMGLQVLIDIAHSWVSDLSLTLVHPNGQEIKLWENNCANQSVSNSGFIFDDEATAIPQQCPSTLQTSYAPVAPLSSLHGLSATGTWTLRLQDSDSGENGQLNAWKIALCTTDSTNLTIPSINTLKDATIYPNPNTGVFTADFGQNSAKNYEVILYDLLGRQVFQMRYNTPKNLINVKGLSSGNYLMMLQTETARTVSQVVIQ